MLVLVGLLALAEGYRLGIHPEANRLHQTLRPGLYVQMLGAILVGSGAIHLWRNALAHGAMRPAGSATATRRALLLVGALAGYALLIDRLGYLAASLPFFVAVLRVFGVTSILRIGVLSVAMTAAFYVIFIRYFGVIFPRGILEGII